MNDILTMLSELGPCGYAPGSSPAVEPTALATVALAAASSDTARTNADWLVKWQSPEGTLGVTESESAPHWPTGWAVVAWRAVTRSYADVSKTYAAPTQQALHWIAGVQGAPMHSVPELGHDPALVGWPWVEGTHSWVEPTAIAALAFRAAGNPEHTRAEEARNLLYDRQLPSGGWNYGNTVVLGQELLPHVQPTGLALLALRGVADGQRRIALATKYLLRTINQTTTTASLCFAILGLAAHQVAPAAATGWLRQAAGRTLSGDRSPYKLALLALANQALAGQLLAEDIHV